MAGSAVLLLQAQSAVTFVLTNGDRIAGDSADRTDANPIMPYGELNIYAGPDKHERSFGQEVVAVIDYSGGTPSNGELAALPAEGQMLVLKNGTRTQGRIAGLRNGVLRWSGMSGNTEEYPVSQISRIYLNTGEARKVYNYAPGAMATPPAVTPTPPTARGRGGIGSAIGVHANRPWTDTNITVRVNETLRFNTSGAIKFGMGEGQAASADGNPEVTNAAFPVPTAPVGALIGRIGTGTPFLIGSKSDPMAMPQTGRLFIGINDDGYGDNTGQFTVIVTRNQ
jgi:hypothetical protein